MIALINGSPKATGSASQVLIDRMKSYEPAPTVEFTEVHLRDCTVTAEQLATLAAADTWIIVFPLYADSIPGHLTDCLLQLSQLAKEAADTKNAAGRASWDGAPSAADARAAGGAHTGVSGSKKVYAVVAMGFYEGHQTRWALNVMANFCVKAGYEYCGGVGVGGTGGFGMMAKNPAFKGPMITVDTPLLMLREYAAQGTVIGDSYTTVKFPRFAYKLGGQSGWRRAIKENGGSAKDLGRRITLE